MRDSLSVTTHKVILKHLRITTIANGFNLPREWDDFAYGSPGRCVRIGSSVTGSRHVSSFAPIWDLE